MAALSVFHSQSFLPTLLPIQKRISAQAGLQTQHKTREEYNQRNDKENFKE